MSLEPGTRLGVFEVLGPIGVGGMGEVYRARDTRLGREVAIKVLPEAFARDPDRVARFEREARMLASINHPAIAAIYGAEESGDVPYIVMELVPGETLADRMARGPLSLEESLSYALQVAEALEGAHEKGVVHRDLKPSNVKVKPDGKIKVLDLGLAKMMEEPPEASDLSHSPTLLMQDQTRPGTILGTVEFMSPEQARGKEVDKRTDIWAFGCLLFEMLSGKRAFTGETVSDVLVAILTKEPAWDALPADTPPRMRELLSRCLEKDANQRLRDIGDARVEIDRALARADESVPPAAAASPRRAWGVAAVLALLLVGSLVWLILRSRLREAPPGAIGVRSLVVLPANIMGDSPGGQLVGDGLVETLSVRLNDVPGIQVVTPAAAVAASDKNADPFGAARSVGANLVVRSSVVRSGERVRIIYSVWNVQTRAQMAGGTVDGAASDLFGMQDQLAENVAAKLKLPKPAKKGSTPTGLETASEQERYIQALGYLQRYDKPASVDAAIRLLEALAAERPDAALVQAALGRGHLYKFNLTREKTWADKAAESASRAHRLAPELPEVDATLGELYIRTGKPQDATGAFRRALALQPGNFDALLGLARAYDAAGDAPQSEATYRRSIALQPSFWAGYSKLGGFYFNRGQYAQAAEMFRRVTELSADNARAFGNLGAAYQNAGAFDKALEAYHRSLALEPTHLTYSNIGTLEYVLGHYKNAADAFEKAIQITPGHFQLWVNLGDAYRWTKGLEGKAPAAYARAIELSRDELKVNPKDPFVLAHLGVCLAKTGKIQQARGPTQLALSLAPKNPEVLCLAAATANLEGRSAEALERIRRAVEAGYSRAIIARDPDFTNLRSESAFRETMRND
jgi:tetratricopeptide (TPR) repeat protein